MRLLVGVPSANGGFYRLRLLLSSRLLSAFLEEDQQAALSSLSLSLSGLSFSPVLYLFGGVMEPALMRSYLLNFSI